MDDLINRQVAINYIKQQRARRFVACSIEEVMITILEELPSAQQEQRWIPVSERLPEERQDVLVCTKYQGITDGMHEHGTWWIAWGERCYEDEENLILAWMPLPAPYRPEGEEHERA